MDFAVEVGTENESAELTVEEESATLVVRTFEDFPEQGLWESEVMTVGAEILLVLEPRDGAFLTRMGDSPLAEGGGEDGSRGHEGLELQSVEERIDGHRQVLKEVLLAGGCVGSLRLIVNG